MCNRVKEENTPLNPLLKAPTVGLDRGEAARTTQMIISDKLFIRVIFITGIIFFTGCAPELKPETDIYPPLKIEFPVADKASPRFANMANIRWTVRASGGSGDYTYEFYLLEDKGERLVQSGVPAYWDWRPDQAGMYKVKTVVKDALGNIADSGWSDEYEIRNFMKTSPVAVLPVENLSGIRAPAKKAGQSLTAGLKSRGINVIADDVLDNFMAKHRIRYTGAIDLVTARAFKEELGAEAVLITSIELYSELYPPKISLISRLTSTGSRPEILWMHSVGLSGDDSPGILGLGLIEDPSNLLRNAVESLSDSLCLTLSPDEKRRGPSGAIKDRPALIVKAPGSSDEKRLLEDEPEANRYVPKIFYRSPVLSPDVKYRIAIMPFLNKSERKNAGDIMALHFTEQLREVVNYDVIEPGIVRQNLLGFRIIMNEGMSYENASLIFSTLETDADLILSGTVLDYQDNISTEGTPKVDFSVIVIERKSREVVWSSKSYRTGDEGVIFFDRGRINVAHSLASGMVRGVTELILMK